MVMVLGRPCPVCEHHSYSQSDLRSHLWSAHRGLAVLVETIAGLAQRVHELELENAVLYTGLQKHEKTLGPTGERIVSLETNGSPSSRAQH